MLTMTAETDTVSRIVAHHGDRCPPLFAPAVEGRIDVDQRERGIRQLRQHVGIVSMDDPVKITVKFKHRYSLGTASAAVTGLVASDTALQTLPNAS